jgi:hypothetical protein
LSISSDTATVAYEYLKENFEEIASALPGELMFWFLPMIAQTFDDPARGADVAAFFKDKNPMQTGGPHMIEQVLESIELNHAAKRAHQESLVRFLSNFQQELPAPADPRGSSPGGTSEVSRAAQAPGGGMAPPVN